MACADWEVKVAMLTPPKLEGEETSNLDKMRWGMESSNFNTPLKLEGEETPNLDNML